MALVREKSNRKPQYVAQVTICRRSEYVFIRCQHQRCSHYCIGQGTGATLSLENTPILFAACPVTIFATLPRTIDRSNAKLGEGVKHLF